jgi:CRISPR system Cascade subunit CasD
MQAWGTEAKWEVRDAGREPSKSGVVGILAAALGRSRAEPVDDLAHLRMGVRVEREGVLKKDFQTAMDVSVLTGGRRQIVSTRYYLADAEFLVALEGPQGLLNVLNAALDAPVFPTFLGRKSFLPSSPIQLRDGLYPDAPLQQVLRTRQWAPSLGKGDPPARLRVIEETERAQGDAVRRDQPVGASFASREFLLRYVTTYWVEPPLQNVRGEDG